MNFSDNSNTHAQTAPNHADTGARLAREAGVRFQGPNFVACGIDPIAEWLGLMEVVQMLCPVWPVRDSPMQGSNWRL